MNQETKSKETAAAKAVAPERPHKGWVRFLTILAGVITVLAILSTWVDRQLFDTEEWGNTSLKVLQQPEVQKALADYAVEELYDNVNVEAELKQVLPGDTKDLSGVAAGALRSVADKGAQQALGNQQVQDLWRQANETAQKTLVNIIEDESNVLETSGGEVTLELRPLIIEIADQIGLGKEANENIPDSVGNIEIVNSDELSTVQTAASLIHGTALITALLVCLLIGLAVYLSPGYRWLTVFWLAVALILAALVVLVLRSVIGDVVVSGLADVDIEPAAQAGYDAATDLMKSIAWTVIWGGVGMIAIAWLISPNGAAESTRKLLAVPFGRYPGAVFALLGVVALIYLIAGAGDQRTFLVHLMVVILLGIGAWFFRRQLMLEYPDADFQQVGELGERVRASAGKAWAGRPKSLPKPSFGKGGSKGDETAPAPEVDPETRRLDQLERLASMHKSGVLTDEEFAEEKARVRNSGD
ncbi:MAG: SHOCT domain-containing protein [Acidobacteriota bacterium]